MGHEMDHVADLDVWTLLPQEGTFQIKLKLTNLALHYDY